MGCFQSMCLTKGQATVEYLLITILVVSLAAVIGGPLGAYLKNFSGGLIGPTGYYACLTEKGLLPEPSSSNLCSASLTNLSFTAVNRPIFGGTPRSGGAPGSGEDSPGKGSSGENGNVNDSSKNNSRAGSRGSRFSRYRSGSSGRGSNNRYGTLGPGGEGVLQEGSQADSRSRFNIKKSQSRKDKNKKRSRIAKSSLAGSSFKKNNKGYKKIKIEDEELIEEGGYLGTKIIFEKNTEKQKAFKMKASEIQKKSSINEEGKSPQIIKDQLKKKSLQIDSEDKGFDFGNFLKYLFIAILILTILLVAFFQFMEYQNQE